MELNRDQIIKALDWLDNLVDNDNGMAMFTYQLLGILYDTCEELTEENERLIADNTVLLETMHTPHKEPEGTLRIKLNVPKGSDTIYRLRSAKQIKIDTVGEMQRLLMLEYSDCINEETISVGGLRENIDKIIKKMLED